MLLIVRAFKPSSVLLVCLLLSACSSGDSPAIPAPPVNPTPTPDGPIVGEEVKQAARFWLAQPRFDPGGDGWRRLGTTGAELLRATYDDRQEGTFLRQRAVACLGHFREPWVGEYLEKLLSDLDAPPPVRADAARSLLIHGALLEDPTAPLELITSLIVDPEQPVGLRRQLPAILGLVPGEVAAASLRSAREAVTAQRPPLDDSVEAKQDSVAATVVTKALELALGEHALAAERAALASQLGLRFSATERPVFTPAPPEERRVGVTGPDHLGTWRAASVCVSVTSSLPEDIQLRFDFDPLEKGLKLSGRNIERVETVLARPRQRATACRKLEIIGVPIVTEVWVYAEDFFDPIHRERIRIDPERAR